MAQPASDRVRAMVAWITAHATEIGSTRDSDVTITLNAHQNEIKGAITRYDKIRAE